MLRRLRLGRGDAAPGPGRAGSRVAGEDPAYEKLAELTVAHAAVLGLDCIDLAPLFRAHDETNPGDSFKRPPEDGGHLSVRGNVLVADALMGRLERRVSTD